MQKLCHRLSSKVRALWLTMPTNVHVERSTCTHHYKMKNESTTFKHDEKSEIESSTNYSEIEIQNASFHFTI